MSTEQMRKNINLLEAFNRRTILKVLPGAAASGKLMGVGKLMGAGAEDPIVHIRVNNPRNVDIEDALAEEFEGELDDAGIDYEEVHSRGVDFKYSIFKKYLPKIHKILHKVLKEFNKYEPDSENLQSGEDDYLERADGESYRNLSFEDPTVEINGKEIPLTDYLQGTY